MMRDRGVHIWEGRCWFLTTAHTDADLELVFEAFRDTIAEMQAADFLPGGAEPPRSRSPSRPRRRRSRGVVRARSGTPGEVPAGRGGRRPVAEHRPVLRPVDFDPFAPASAREVRLPLTEPQAEMWTAAAMSREANCSYNQCFAFTFHGPLRVESLRAALDQVVARHDALRAVIAPDGTRPDAPAAVLGRDAAHRPVGPRSGGATA